VTVAQKHLLDSHIPDRLAEIVAEDAVAIP
jgi:hypothetical protein